MGVHRDTYKGAIKLGQFKEGREYPASGTTELLLMISYCRLRISSCNILLKSLSFLFNLCQFHTYRLLCLLLVTA